MNSYLAGATEALAKQKLNVGLSRSRLTLALLPDWRHIRPMRDYVGGLVLSFSSSRDFADRCAMCASELLENAVKYSIEATEIRLVLDLDFDQQRVRICVENSAQEERIVELAKVLDQVNAGNPFDSYILMLSQAANREGVVSQVGLGRVRAEGNACLQFDRLVDNTVRMTADIPEKRS